jgi:hypothetical protein
MYYRTITDRPSYQTWVPSCAKRTTDPHSERNGGFFIVQRYATEFSSIQLKVCPFLCPLL